MLEIKHAYFTLFAFIFTVSCATGKVSTSERSEESNVAVGESKKLIELPEGWSLSSYAKDSNCIVPGKPAPAASVEGDFDGDGIADYAKILKRHGKRQEKLFVWLSSQDYKSPIEMDRIEKDAFNRMTISLAHKGEKIESTCKRGYEETCGNGDPDEVVLKADGLWFTLCESAASVFYWDSVKGKFLRQWYSD